MRERVSGKESGRRQEQEERRWTGAEREGDWREGQGERLGKGSGARREAGDRDRERDWREK